MYKLHIRDDAGKTKVVNVKRDKITVGRREGNTIRLTDRNVSRTHARLVRKDGKVFVEDVSRYGTRVNGLRLKERKALSAEDVVVIGDYELKVEVQEQPTEILPAVQNKSPQPTKEAKRQEAPTRVERSVGSVDSTSMINLNDIEQAARDQASKKTRIVADVATLVAVNTELAGTEYRLSGAEIVIGRTDENDVVVDHRSISRNHARIVSKDGRVTIFDLDSANGLKINDEFYKQSVLRRGDVIELGHVRMRFVETGETFVYRPEEWKDKNRSSGESSTTRSASGGSKKVWIIALLFIAAAGSAVAVALSGQDKADLEGTVDQGASTTQAASSGKPSSAEEGRRPGNSRAENQGTAARLERASAATGDPASSDGKSSSEASKAVDSADEKVAAAEKRRKKQAAEDLRRANAKRVKNAQEGRDRSGVNRASKTPTLAEKARLDARKEADRQRREDNRRAAARQKAEAKARAKAELEAKRAKEAAANASSEKLTWKDYRRKAAKAGDGRLAVYKEAASKGFAQAYFYIGRTSHATGKKAEAIKAYRKFIRLRPSSAKADQAKQALMALGASF